MSQHTKEPWFVNVSRQDEEYPFVTVVDAEGRTLFQCMNYRDRPKETALSNAQRIASCVNACQHYSTEDLEDVGEHLSGVLFDTRTRCAELIAQRDELLAALNKLVELVESCDPYGNLPVSTLGDARKAIAKAVQL